MRFASLSIQNFRAIREFGIHDLTDFVLIAGPNGCGKSCVLDAIRLIKSVYGGYQDNEWQQWFGEFQISLTDREQLFLLMRDPSIPLVVHAEVQLAAEEKNYIDANAEGLLRPIVWADQVGDKRRSTIDPIAMSIQHRQHVRTVEEKVRTLAAIVRTGLTDEHYRLHVKISKEHGISVEDSPVMELVFKTYQPADIGIVDYHSASRAYQREALGGVDLNVQNMIDQRKTHHLYNWQSKYQNVKTELAVMYFRDLVRKEVGEAPAQDSDLNDVMTEMFQIFFPDKEYLGVRPDPNGSLNFPVRLRTGETHDLNELSSGEKEVVYGYLRMRSSAARNSTLLLDEPELHLNPGLLQGFSDFYHRHLGRARGNQLWLVTHSDTLLRHAVGNANYSVLHMMSATTDPSGNQAVPVEADGDLDRALIDLIGDLAMYQPRGKVVIFEGGGDTEFDVHLTKRLFPEVAKNVNLVSGGHKRRVRDLYDVLAQTAEQVGVAKRFYAVVDKDTDVRRAAEVNTSVLVWDVYHIENYLLKPEFVRAATASLAGIDRFTSEEQVLDLLRECAKHIIPSLRIEFLRTHANSAFMAAIDLGARPNSREAVEALLPSIERTRERLHEAGELLTDGSSLMEVDRANLARLESALEDDSWMRQFPGRRVLKRYVDLNVRGLASYEGFRNVVIDRMVDANYQPSGMKEVIEKILND